MSIISNTTVISNFASVDQLDVLQRLYGSIYISSEVFAEVQTGLDEGYQFYQDIHQNIYPAASTGWIVLTSMVTEQELALFASLPGKLHAGEASCLAIALYRNWTLLTDDQRARREAKKLEIRLSGTIGCLLMAIERKVCELDAANALLQHMIEAGYRSPITDLSTLLPNRKGD
ncbi:MAG: hypothetical protein DCC55_40825 [Chloroflexi bacterium]|nr:MAG: hypothetical protein DCC55_40825 [Chloroflexota bacterium]